MTEDRHADTDGGLEVASDDPGDGVDVEADGLGDGVDVASDDMGYGVDVDPDELADDPTPCAYTEYRSGADPADLPATGEGADGIEGRVWDALSDVEDPEMPISIVDLGLVYGVDVMDGHATVDMTLTYTGCPARDMLQRDVESAVESVVGVDSAGVRLVWSPEWSVDMVTDAGKDDLREFGLSV